MRVSPSEGMSLVLCRATELMLSRGEKSVIAPRGSLEVAKSVVQITFPLCDASRTYSKRGYWAAARLGIGSVYQITMSNKWSVETNAGSRNGGTSLPRWESVFCWAVSPAPIFNTSNEGYPTAGTTLL